MNLFSKLFNRNGAIEASEQVSIDPVNNLSNEEFRQLFTDQNPPLNEFEVKKENLLKLFMEQNFFSKGYNDGYEFHCRQSLENGISNIKSEYRHLIEIVIDESRAEIYLLNMNKIQTEGIPGNITEMFDLRIDTINEVISKCREEYDLAENNKGHVEFPINNYKSGFENGQLQYFNEKFFANSTGLFT